MKLIHVKTFNGPNYWSINHKQLVELTIEPGKWHTLSVNDISVFSEKLQNILPSLFKPTREFFPKIKSGICTADIILQVARELQVLAGMNCSFYKAETNEDRCRIVFSYVGESAGIYAGETAFKIVETLLKNEKIDTRESIEELIYLKSRSSIGPTSDYILQEVKKRGIPYRRFNNGSLMALGYGRGQKKIRTAITDDTSGLGMELAGDKEETKQMLWEAHVPVPWGILVSDEDELKERINEVRFPLVIKPLDGNHGRGVTTDIRDMEKALFGLKIAQRISKTVIVEEFIEGSDYRLLVINNKLVAATLRSPASVTGDGHSTIRELINAENNDPQRGESADYVLALIKVDEVTEKILARNNLTMESVLPAGQILVLKETANISSGGTATDVTDIVHPENIFMAERIARLFNLDICGVDLVAKRIDQPIVRGTGAVIEVNAGPGLRMHSNPQKGTPRHVAGKIVDMLFPETNSALIPIIAIAEFEGADILARYISHLASGTGLVPGCNTSNGIYINEHGICTGDFTDYDGEQEVLFDPSIDLAVLECSAKSISARGLGFDKCDVAIISEFTKVNDEKGIADNDETLKLWKVLVETTVSSKGTVILNADDDEVYNLLKEVNGSAALYSVDRSNEKVRTHCLNGGWAAVVEKNKIVILEGDIIVSSIEIKEMPFAWEDEQDTLPKYILPAVLSASLLGWNMGSVSSGINSYSFPLKETHA